MNSRSWLRGYVLFSIAGTLVAALLMALDGRQLLGESVWLKPLKFFIATAVYSASLLWVLGPIANSHPKLTDRTAKWSALGMLLEMVIICIQAARGVRSHFNYATLPDMIAFQIMGVTIVGVWILALLSTIALFRVREGDSTRILAARWGMVLFLAGSMIGNAMPRPTPEQLAVLSRGEKALEIGAHTIGAPDGTTRKMPGTGWSMEAGDLRVAHFIGMHMLQLMMALAYLSTRSRKARSSMPIHLAGFGGLMVFIGTAAQAFSARSLVDLSGAMGVLIAVGTFAILLASGLVALPGRLYEARV